MLLYRLRMWRGTRWLNIYVGARANHTVHYLEQGTAHLFRLQAPRASSRGYPPPPHPPAHPRTHTHAPAGYAPWWLAD